MPRNPELAQGHVERSHTLVEKPDPKEVMHQEIESSETIQEWLPDNQWSDNRRDFVELVETDDKKKKKLPPRPKPIVEIAIEKKKRKKKVMSVSLKPY